jgi:hypothetical protein
MSGELSIPTTRAPAAAIRSVNAPSPQPTSRISSPGCGASICSTASPSAGTKAAFLA